MRKQVEWYRPSIGDTDWDIKTLDKSQRQSLRDRLVMGTVHDEKEYQTVIGYMYSKFPHLMDITGTVKNPLNDEIVENTSIQWKYSPFKNKVKVFNEKTGENFDMYAFIYYDKERDYEPICFAGSYFKYATVDLHTLLYDDELESLLRKFENSGTKIKDCSISTAIGEGYVMFCDPSYRRLGLGNFSWTAESQLYRDCSNSDLRKCSDSFSIPMIIPCQMEIQNEYSIKSTISCFEPDESYPETTVKEPIQDTFGKHSKHLFISSNGRVKNDGTRCQIRIIMNYLDKNLENSFNSMPDNMKEIYNKPYWNFLERESRNLNMSVDEYRNMLTSHWNS